MVDQATPKCSATSRFDLAMYATSESSSSESTSSRRAASGGSVADRPLGEKQGKKRTKAQNQHVQIKLYSRIQTSAVTTRRSTLRIQRFGEAHVGHFQGNTGVSVREDVAATPAVGPIIER